ncbi:DNA polymerase III subunit beta [Zhongshania borealis]|uniref:Beta sliding clamp n=1 Tax=Zhongshania borealis TaxID=889488 RepID=A0ABP7WEL5_9GAMM
MNITVNAQGLAAALRNNLAERRSTLNIFEHVLLTATANPPQLSIVSSDGARELEVIIDVERVDEEGAITCHAGKLKAAIMGLAGPVVIKLADREKATVSQQRRRFVVPSLSARDYPNCGAMGKTTVVKADPKALAEAIERVQYASAKMDVRVYITGVHFNEGDVVATDGHRLACATIKADMPAVTVPNDSIKYLVAALKEEGAVVSCSESAIEVTSNAGRFRSALLEGRYPDYRRLTNVPQGAAEASIAPEHIAPALQRLKSFVSQFGAIKVTATADTLFIAPNDEITDETAATINKEWPEVGLNIAYLADLCAAMSGPFTWINSGGLNQQVFISSDDVVHIIQPMRL